MRQLNSLINEVVANRDLSVTNNDVSWHDPVPTNIGDQAAAAALRLGDGSWTDDTAVAFAIRAMADVGTPDDFTILSFVGARSVPGVRGAVPLPVEFERLFSGGGEDAAGVVNYCLSLLCIDTMSPAVFDGSALDSAVVRWSYTDGVIAIQHVEIPVVTVDNATYGVTAGHSGVVHVVVSTLVDAPVVPVDGTSFGVYADLLGVVRTGVVDGGGWAGLAEVLGIR